MKIQLGLIKNVYIYIYLKLSFPNYKNKIIKFYIFREKIQVVKIFQIDYFYVYLLLRERLLLFLIEYFGYNENLERAYLTYKIHEFLKIFFMYFVNGVCVRCL